MQMLLRRLLFEYRDFAAEMRTNVCIVEVRAEKGEKNGFSAFFSTVFLAMLIESIFVSNKYGCAVGCLLAAVHKGIFFVRTDTRCSKVGRKCFEVQSVTLEARHNNSEYLRIFFRQPLWEYNFFWADHFGKYFFPRNGVFV